jgi:hypothetical protein
MSLLIETDCAGMPPADAPEEAVLRRMDADNVGADEIADARATGKCPRCGRGLDRDEHSGRCLRNGCAFAY